MLKAKITCVELFMIYLIRLAGPATGVVPQPGEHFYRVTIVYSNKQLLSANLTIREECVLLPLCELEILLAVRY